MTSDHTSKWNPRTGAGNHKKRRWEERNGREQGIPGGANKGRKAVVMAPRHSERRSLSEVCFMPAPAALSLSMVVIAQQAPTDQSRAFCWFAARVWPSHPERETDSLSFSSLHSHQVLTFFLWPVGKFKRNPGKRHLAPPSLYRMGGMATTAKYRLKKYPRQMGGQQQNHHQHFWCFSHLAASSAVAHTPSNPGRGC